MRVEKRSAKGEEGEGEPETTSGSHHRRQRGGGEKFATQRGSRDSCSANVHARSSGGKRKRRGSEHVGQHANLGHRLGRDNPERRAQPHVERMSSPSKGRQTVRSRTGVESERGGGEAPGVSPAIKAQKKRAREERPEREGMHAKESCKERS